MRALSSPLIPGSPAVGSLVHAVITATSSSGCRSTWSRSRVLAYGIYYRRHGRRDLVVIYAMFNVGLFLALVAISSGNVSAGVGFGLFAVLSIVRLRSEPFSNGELAYFFVALVIGLVCGIDVGGLVLADPAQRGRAGRRRRDRPPAAAAPDAAARGDAGDDPGRPGHAPAPPRGAPQRARSTECRVLEIDYVRETTRVSRPLRDRRP